MARGPRYAPDASRHRSPRYAPDASRHRSPRVHARHTRHAPWSGISLRFRAPYDVRIVLGVRAGHPRGAPHRAPGRATLGELGNERHTLPLRTHTAPRDNGRRVRTEHAERTGSATSPHADRGRLLPHRTVGHLLHLLLASRRDAYPRALRTHHRHSSCLDEQRHPVSGSPHGVGSL